MIINSYSFATAGGSPTNWALASNGSSVTASDTYSGSFPASSVIDGLRHTNNAWGSGGGYISGRLPSGGSPVALDVDFGTTRAITEIDVISLKSGSSNYNTEPTLSDTNTASEIPYDFKLQYWNGSAWTDISTITGNDKVWRQVTFSSISTTKIRVSVTATYGGWLAMVEIEAWG